MALTLLQINSLGVWAWEPGLSDFLLWGLPFWLWLMLTAVTT